MSLEEILGAAADAGMVVKAITVLVGNGPSSEDSNLSRHTFGTLFYKRRLRFCKATGGDV
jgi:hypothetical protein